MGRGALRNRAALVTAAPVWRWQLPPEHACLGSGERQPGAAQVPGQRRCRPSAGADAALPQIFQHQFVLSERGQDPRLIFFPAVLAAEPGCPISTLPIPIPSRPVGSTSSPTPISQQTRGTFSSPRIFLSHHLFRVCIVSKQAGCLSLHGHGTLAFAYLPALCLDSCRTSSTKVSHARSYA